MIPSNNGGNVGPNINRFLHDINKYLGRIVNIFETSKRKDWVTKDIQAEQPYKTRT
jgi:hypothetical protein